MTTPTTVRVRIAGLSCESCVKLCTMKLKKLPGVQGVSIDLKSGDATVSADGPITLEELQVALAGTHYEVHPQAEPEPLPS